MDNEDDGLASLIFPHPLSRPCATWPLVRGIAKLHCASALETQPLRFPESSRGLPRIAELTHPEIGVEAGLVSDRSTTRSRARIMRTMRLF